MRLMGTYIEFFYFLEREGKKDGDNKEEKFMEWLEKYSRGTPDQGGDTYEASEFPSFHRWTKCKATHGVIPSERNPETSWLTLTHMVTKKISTSK